jgi:hypothetical protein
MIHAGRRAAGLSPLLPSSSVPRVGDGEHYLESDGRHEGRLPAEIDRGQPTKHADPVIGHAPAHEL